MVDHNYEGVLRQSVALTVWVGHVLTWFVFYHDLDGESFVVAVLQCQYVCALSLRLVSFPKIDYCRLLF